MTGTILRYALAGLLAVAFGCDEPDKPRAGEPGSDVETSESEAREQAEGMDKFVEEELASNKHAEARDWCDPRHKTHMGFEVSTSEMLRLVNEMYAAGAAKVYVTGIDELAGRQISAAMAMELPTDPAARKKVFEWQHGFAQMIDDEPMQDFGQKYYYMALD